MSRLPSFVRNSSGASAAEFAMVLPLFLMLLLGIIDAGRWMWEMNEAQKATQMGARFAAVTTNLAPGLISQDYVGNTAGGTALKSGDTIPAAALGVVRCRQSDGCTCQTTPCPTNLGTMDQAAFDLLVARMTAMYPKITDDNVEVRYSGSGFGTAGNVIVTGGGGGGGGGGGPIAPQITPMITVSLTGVQFQPITSMLMANFNLPQFQTTLPAEDSAGDYSN
nr:TadE family protein [uncultured Sphingomonas sp.]